MSESAVLIVARADDAIACRLRSALENRGWRVEWLDGPGAARRFTIRVGPETTVVTPNMPIFVRPSAWWLKEPDSADERFLRAEAHAAFWAAAAVTPAPVINRPARNGIAPRMTAGTPSHRSSSRNELPFDARP